jgi:selenocysteine lyase/cysteine desulfurase
LLGIGVERIAAYDQHLVECFLAGLDPTRYDLRVPRDPARRSTLVFFSHRDPSRNGMLHARLKAQGIDIAYRRGLLRLAPHLYNTPEDMDRALRALNSVQRWT